MKKPIPLVSNKLALEFPRLKEVAQTVHKIINREPDRLQEALHILEVVENCARISELEGLDSESQEVTVVAALLHDIGATLDSSRPHPIVSAEHARTILGDFGYTAAEIDRICSCIETHSITSSDRRPLTLEQKIVFDADYLTVFTVVGVGRWFTLSAKRGYTTDAVVAMLDLLRLYEWAIAGQLFHTMTASELLRHNAFFQDYVHYVRSRLTELTILLQDG